MKSKLKKVTVYTDGACSGNPGPGGWGVVLIYKSIKKEMSGFDKETTNNAQYVRGQRNRQMARGKVNYPLVYINKNDLKTFSLLSTNITNHVAEFMASSINGGITQESFASFKASFSGYRMDEYMGILQKAYDDFYGIKPEANE